MWGEEGREVSRKGDQSTGKEVCGAWRGQVGVQHRKNGPGRKLRGIR